MCVQNLKFVALPIPEIIGGTQKIWTVPGYAQAPFSPEFFHGLRDPLRPAGLETRPRDPGASKGTPATQNASQKSLGDKKGSYGDKVDHSVLREN